MTIEGGTGRSRRGRLWRRPARFNNRAIPKGWLAPTIQHKLDSHVRSINFVKSILPITKTIIETAKFDIQKIKNPEIEGKSYQEGAQKDFHNTKAYILHRDNHECQICSRSGIPLEIHHIVARRDQGTNIPENLITLCKDCHKKVTNGELKITKEVRSFKPETFTSIIRKKLLDRCNALETFGYLTKLKRDELNIEKSHSNDAFVTANGESQVRSSSYNIIQCRRINRKLRTCYKGRKPGLRRMRYPYKPKDLVKLGNKILEVVNIYMVEESILESMSS